MALSYVEYPTSGSEKAFDLTFGYLSRTHVFAFLDNELVAYKWLSPTRIELVDMPAEGKTLRAARLTDRQNRITHFSDGVTLLSNDLNVGDLQNFYILQEIADGIADGVASGIIQVNNPGGPYITEQWIQSQLIAAVGASPALEELLGLIQQEVTDRNQALLEEAQARAEEIATAAEAAISTAADALAAEITDRLAGDEAATALVVAESEARTSADEALASSLDALGVSFETTEGELIALVGAEATARADADTAEAIARGLVQAEVQAARGASPNLNARIAAEETARANGDTAEATARSLVDAKIETPVTGLKARATSLESRTAAVESGKADLTALSALSSTVGGHTSSIASLQSTAVDLQNNKATATDLTSLRAEARAAYGSGVNLIDNAEWMDVPLAGTNGWTGLPAGVTLGIADGSYYSVSTSGSNVWGSYATGGDWVPPGTRVIIHQTNGPGGYWDFRTPIAQVTPGQKYIVSAYVGCHRMSTRVFIEWLDANGAPLGNTDPNDANSANNNQEYGGNSLAAYKRVFAIGTAPANARKANFNISRTGTLPGETSSFFFYTRPMFEEARPQQTAPSQWQPGKHDSQRANVDILKTALTTGNSSEARLLIKVNTTTNQATFEMGAFSGQGVWNGSAIKLSALNIILDGNVIVTGSLNTGAMANNAVTSLSTSYEIGTGGTSPVGDGWTFQRILTVQSTGAPMVITSSMVSRLAADPNGYGTHSVRIRRHPGGTLLYSCEDFNSTGGIGAGNVVCRPWSATIVDQPGAGVWNYAIETAFSGNNISVNNFSNKVMTILETKK